MTSNGLLRCLRTVSWAYCPQALATHTSFWAAFRRMPTAKAKGKFESQGGFGKVLVRRVYRHIQIDTCFRQSPSASSEALENADFSHPYTFSVGTHHPLHVPSHIHTSVQTRVCVPQVSMHGSAHVSISEARRPSPFVRARLWSSSTWENDTPSDPSAMAIYNKVRE